MAVSAVLVGVYPHEDSNLSLCLRRAALYPLSYGGADVAVILAQVGVIATG